MKFEKLPAIGAWPVILVALTIHTQPTTAGKPPGANVAAGKPYTFRTRPNYRHCTDPGDTTQLTDGRYSVGYFWVQKSTVGWNGRSPIVITIDLGRTEPIAGVSYSTAAGVAGVAWPAAVFILTSEDGKSYRLAGDLIELSAERGLPEPDKYATHRYVTDKLRTKGRYVALAIKASGQFTFCDEIEVYRGADDWLGQPMTGKPVKSIVSFVKREAVTAGVKYRLRKDLAEMRQAVEQAELAAESKAKLLSRLDGFAPRIDALEPITNKGFRAVVPLNDVHAGILAVNAALLRARGLKPLTVWHKNRWDMLSPREAPPETPGKPLALEVVMMDNEYRAEVFNLTNATDEAIVAHLRIAGLPGGDDPPYVTVHQVEFVDTQEKIVIADALPVVPRSQQGYRITIPAGMSRQVWLTFHPQGLKPGAHPGKIKIDAGAAGTAEVGLTLRLGVVRFPDQPTCSLGMWDYTDKPYVYEITEGNRDLAIRNMREHFVDSPWSHGQTAPRPTAADLDADGNLVGKLDFRRFDKWVTDWKGARHYYCFLNVGDSLAGAKIGTPRFNRAVSTWAAAWAGHNAQLGLEPGQVGVLLVDEPSKEPQDRRILAWAQAIKNGTSGITIWQDPVHRAPWQAKVQEMFQVCDVLCPNLAIYKSGGRKSRQFYEKLRVGGRRLWFYQCSGPARLHDPYYYHRLQQWHCWVARAVGSGFWAYGDGAGTTPWNDYAASRTSYTPVYLDEDSITDGKHWEAVREGIEDYEYLRILGDRIARLERAGTKAPALDRAKELLKTLPAEVATYDPAKISWTVRKDRGAADRARIRILDVLEVLAKPTPESAGAIR